MRQYSPIFDDQHDVFAMLRTVGAMYVACYPDALTWVDDGIDGR
ncbi:hypothetical protein [Burkholderia sp. BCC1972]|nr:hypothetical protein [Burkholderia sp. BCC1972]